LSQARKNNLHARNPHVQGYPFDKLVKSHAPLANFIRRNPDGRQTINFSDPNAVKALNAALLSYYYQINMWQLPEGYLCPAVPGRADYIHYLADLLADSNQGQIPKGKQIVGLDIGTGANLIYPIVGSQSYGWSFVGSELDPVSEKSAQLILKANPNLQKHVNVRRQQQAKNIFDDLIRPQDKFAFSMCNPPFFHSAKHAQQQNQRKVDNLARHKKKRNADTRDVRNKDPKQQLNFAGQANELHCPGGELAFIKQMIQQSKTYAQQVGWFTSLVSNKDNLRSLYQKLEQTGVTEVKTIKMAQGQKQSRFVAWCFNTKS